MYAFNIMIKAVPPGGGVYAHPDGAEAGARSVRQAWDATIKGIHLEDYAQDHHGLARVLEHFGNVIYRRVSFCLNPGRTAAVCAAGLLARP